MKQLLLLFFLTAATLLPAAESFVLNPADFKFRVSGSAEVTMEALQAEIRIVNRTPRKPHTYGVLTATYPLSPGVRYHLTLKAKGKDAAGIVVAFGPKWSQRLQLTGLKEEWKEFSCEFTPAAEEFNNRKEFPVSILSENRAEYALLGELLIAPVPEEKPDSAIIPDGSFEAAATDAVPPGWQFSVNRDATVKMTVSEREAIDGAKSLLITNSSPRQPHVYGTLSRKIRVIPGVKYQLTLQARGENANFIAFVLGKRWRPRFSLGSLPNAWKSFRFEFTPQPEDLESDGTLTLRILSEGIADVAYLDNLKIVPAGGETVAPEQFQSHKIYPLPAEQPGVALQLPADRQHYQGKLPAKEIFHATLNFRRVPEGLAFRAEVTDREIHTPDSEKFWNGDSLQLRFSPGLFREGGDGDLELIFRAPSPDGSVEGRDTAGNRTLGQEEAKLSGKRTESGYLIEGILTGKLLKGFDLAQGFSFNAVINNIRDDNHREIAFLGNGIHRQKGAQDNLRFLPLNGKEQLFAAADRRKSIRRAEGILYATGIHQESEWPLAVTLTDSAGKARELQLPPVPPAQPDNLTEIRFDFDLAQVPEGDYTLAFRTPGGAEAVLQLTKEDLKKKQLTALGNIEKRFLPLEQGVVALTAPSRYLTVPRLLIRSKLDEHRKHLEQQQTPEDLAYYTRIGEWVVPELEAALARLETDYAKRDALPATYTYRHTSKAEPFDVAVIPAADERGKVDSRPFFFAGYGHFMPVAEDMPLLAGLGNNAFQMEIGPRSFFLKSFDEISLNDYRKRIEYAMKRAQENNMRICLLLSPHYHPAWWLEENPEVKSESGFLKYEIAHPKSRDMIKRYLDTVIPILRESPYRAALHSLCLSNEPIYTGARLDKPFTRQHFAEYLTKEYGSLERFNKAAGTAFSSFDALSDAGIAHPAVNYAFHRYKRETLAEWHAWMAGIIRSHWPEAKVSAKIMVFKTLEPAYNNEAVDPELFAAFSDYNGNDNYMYFKTGRWISDWYTMAMYHDLQRSIRDMPVLNSENHTIKDGDLQDIPYGHIYAATFGQFLQGVSGMMTWVWRAVPPADARRRPDLPGNVYQRPGSILAQSTATLDANRLAPEILRFTGAAPKVGILYSPTSYIQNPIHYVRQLKEVYPALAFTGHKIGFRTEKQIAGGDFGTIRLLVLPNVTHLPMEALAGLRQFEQAGGQVITVGETPRYNQFGEASSDVAFAALPGNLPLAQLSRKLGEAADAVEKLPLAMSTTPAESTGVIYRIVADREGFLINIVNYEMETRKITLSGEKGELTDLIAGDESPFTFELKPLELRFLRFKRQ